MITNYEQKKANCIIALKQAILKHELATIKNKYITKEDVQLWDILDDNDIVRDL